MNYRVVPKGTYETAKSGPISDSADVVQQVSALSTEESIEIPCTDKSRAYKKYRSLYNAAKRVGIPLHMQFSKDRTTIYVSLREGQ